MLSIDEILAKAELITLETQIDSITPMRVGELFTSLAEQLRLGVGAGATIGASKLSELADVMLLNNKDNDILQKIGTKWTNIQLDLNKINQISSFWKLDANGNLYTDLNVYSTQGVSAYGAGPDGEGGATGYDRLDAWSLYTNDKSGWVLSALLGKELHDRVLVLEAGGGGGIGTEIDPTVAAHIKNITTGDLTNWATAYAKSHEHDNISILNATTASFLTADRNKLDGIAAGAQVNVQANWDVVSGPAAILNKPYALPASDVYAWAKAATKPTYTFSEIGSTPTTLSGYGITDALLASTFTAHDTTVKHLTAGDRDVLNHFSIVNGALQVDIDFYSTGGVSAYGYGASGGGEGSMVVWGTESAGAVPLTVEGVTKSLSLALHTHSGYLTGNQTITVSGDATGSGTTSIALTLANSGVTAGTYKSVTVDVKGRVTAGTNPTTLAGYGITDALLASAYTAADVLTKLKTVDGIGSGLDADTLDGKHVTASGHWDKIPLIGADGVMEVGMYIDFHEVGTGGPDYAGRLSSYSGSPLWGGNAMYHSGNSNRTDVNWAAATLTAQTDILTPFNTWSHATDKNSLNKFLKLFDIDTAGNLVVKTNLYSTGEVTAYSSGTGVSGLTLMADMNANGKNITNLLSVSNQQSEITMGYGGISFDVLGTNMLNIADDGIYANTSIEANDFYASGIIQSPEFKFGTWTFKQDGSGRLGIYNGTTEVACFNTDGTYVNL